MCVIGSRSSRPGEDRPAAGREGREGGSARRGKRGGGRYGKVPMPMGGGRDDLLPFRSLVADALVPPVGLGPCEVSDMST